MLEACEIEELGKFDCWPQRLLVRSNGSGRLHEVAIESFENNWSMNSQSGKASCWSRVRAVLWCASFLEAPQRKSSYLVDPASSHMLVSKIKPCMSKYKQVCTVKLRMAH